LLCPCDRVVKGKFPGMQAERGLGRGESHGGAERTIGQVGRISADRQTELPEMDADLVCASGAWAGFEQGCAVRQALEDLKVGVGFESGCLINLPRADFPGRRTDRGAA